MRRVFWMQGMLASINGFYDCIRAFWETDQTEDLKRIEVPTLVIHGDDDQAVPIDISSRMRVKLVKRGTLKVISGAPHRRRRPGADRVCATEAKGRLSGEVGLDSGTR